MTSEPIVPVLRERVNRKDDRGVGGVIIGAETLAKGVIGGVENIGCPPFESESMGNVTLPFDDVPAPAAFVAVTINVYEVPFVSPVTVIGEAAPEAVILPGEKVTV